MITREEWGSDLPEQDKEYYRLQLPVKYIVVSSTESLDCYSLEECSKVLKTVQWREKQYPTLFTDLRWNFLIGGDGQIYEGRGWKRKAPMNAKHGSKTWGKGIEIAYIGSYKDAPPPMEMIQPTWDLLMEAFKLKYIKYRFQVFMDVFEYLAFRKEMVRICDELDFDQFRGDVVY